MKESNQKLLLNRCRLLLKRCMNNEKKRIFSPFEGVFFQQANKMLMINILCFS